MNTDFFFSKICTWNKIYFECNYFKENLTKEKYIILVQNLVNKPQI